MGLMFLTHQADRATMTAAVPDFVDVTDFVQDELAASGIRNGQVTVFCPDDDCTILVNEFESGLFADLRRAVERLGNVWPRVVIGARSVVVPAAHGRLYLGTWQRVILVELDRPATRSVVVQILGEA